MPTFQAARCIKTMLAPARQPPRLVEWWEGAAKIALNCLEWLNSELAKVTTLASRDDFGACGKRRDGRAELEATGGGHGSGRWKRIGISITL